MNIQELIEKYEYMSHACFRRVDTLEVLKDLRQLDEPQKVVVPQFVAEHIEWTKEQDFHLLGAMSRESFDKTLEDWFYTDDNMEIFARAWLDGYEVEEEKRYIVKFKGFNPSYIILKYHPYDKTWFLGREQEYNFFRQHHTRKELEEAGFGWVFDCEGVEVEEVTE